MRSARALGFESINVDLIYGLPQQTPRELRAHAGAGQRAAARPHRAVRLRASARALQAAAPHRHRRTARRRAQSVAMLGGAIAGFLAPRLHLHRHGPLRAARRRAGGGQAPGPAAPQLPGLQHAAGLRPDRPGRIGHRPGRRHLQPERQDAGGVLRRAGPGPAAGGARPRARRATTCCGAPSSWRSCARAGWSSSRSSWRTWCACANTSPPNWSSCAPIAARGWSSSSPTRIQVTPLGLVLRARGRDGVRPLSAGRPQARRFSRII